MYKKFSIKLILEIFARNQKLILSLILLLGFFLRIRGINPDGWYDEWSSFFYSNPNYSLTNLYNTAVKQEGSQPLYLVILSLWHNIFGYSPESARLFSIFIGIISIILFYYFVLIVNKKNLIFKILSIFLFSTNFFLIEYSQETRYYSLSVFASLLSLIFFFKFLKNKKYFFLYLFFSIFSLMINIFFMTIVLSYLIIIFFNKRNYIYYLSTFLIILIYLFLDYQFLFNTINRIDSYYIHPVLTVNFLLGYYFNIFFGSVYYGGIILLSLVFLTIYLRKNIYKNNILIFFIISIFSTYFLPIIYSFLKDPILRARYIIFIVPIIIIYLSYLVSIIKNEIIKERIFLILIFFGLCNIFLYDKIIHKPETIKALKVINSSNSKNVYTIKTLHSDYHTNYFMRYNFAKKNGIKFINEETIKNYTYFWQLCLNNPRFAVVIREDNLNCLKNNFADTHHIVESFKVPDYIVNLYKKN